MSFTELLVHGSVQELSAAAGEGIAEGLRRALAGGAATLALAGGSTPAGAYRHIARHYAGLAWEDVAVFWGDERYVAHDSSQSNYRMARETLLDRVPIPAVRVHPMPTDAPDPDDAAGAYEELLWREFGELPRFDVLVLGLGQDGHIASLFPGADALQESLRWVLATEAPSDPRRRLTLTLPVINNARSVHFIVSGARKHGALTRALADRAPSPDCPASLVRPREGTLTWWVDEAALCGRGD
ncbi:MAG: 6-phosphogluconolactonase [Armatimonadota bacterium]